MYKQYNYYQGSCKKLKSKYIVAKLVNIV